jgi:uncharacterized protein YggE
MKKDKTLIISATVIVVVAMIIYAFFQINPSQTISVSGESQIEVVPDLVSVNFNIETRDSTASGAKDTNTEIYDNLVVALTAKGIEESEIKTLNFNVYPEYDWINGRRVEKGYVAQHSVKVELSTDESDKITGIIDAGVDSGALINYINFELSEALQNGKKMEATQKATEDAKIKAEAIAQGLGARLGSIVSVTDSGFNYYPWPLYERADAATVEEAGSAAKTVASAGITPGEQTVYGSVSVVYKIK